ncbi:hypothetical protein EG68_00992 [Paragonimus skrjabini miyazakii]|uniref:PAT complex subunit CCDC47 n=1 Tax=Paragonimus skrjabini miyazakii TaxID=59628 RepID=A0A8S9Z424_9TREM|nr:hypothetical protein EG68_00992 [Paragonimus skrjabini miyazakii]
MLKAFVKSQIDVPLYFIWLLLTALLFQVSSVSGLSLLSDDEFAEFEDPDDTFTVDLADPPPGRSKPSDTRSRDQKADDNRSGHDDSKEKKPAQGSSISEESIDDIPIVHRKPIPPSVIEQHQEDDSESTVESDEFEGLPLKDDEEFEGLPQVLEDPTAKVGSTKGKRPDLTMAKVPHRLTTSWDNYHLEMLIVSVLLVYLLNYFVGRTKNMQLAAAWFEAHKPLLDAQFAMVGDDGQAEPASGTLLKESEHLYSLWCSGRVHCEAMLVELRLIKRQCLLFMLANWLQPTHDTVVAKVIMEDTEMDGWVMAVGPKRRLQALAKDHQDLAFFCPDKRGQRFAGLPESLTVLSEITEATTSMLNVPICKFLTENESSIEYLFFSDQYTGPKPPPEETPSAKLPVAQKVLIFAFRIGNKGTLSVEHMEAATPLFQFIFYTIDKVCRLRLSKEAKAKSDRNRQRARDSRLKAVHSQRQEAAQSRREERVRANKERIMAEEDPEKARKLEEREQRKEKAKRLPKMKMLKSKGM